MLERRENLALGEPLEPARSLQSLDRGDTHFGAEERILAPALLDPAPARVAADVDDGREDERDAACAPRARDHRLDAAQPVGLELPGGRTGLAQKQNRHTAREAKG